MKEIYFPEGYLVNTSENKKHLSSPSNIAFAEANNTILEGNVILCDSSHNLIVDLGCMKGIIPRDEGAVGIKEGVTRDIALISRVGRPVCFTVTELKTDSTGKLYAILSRRNAQLLAYKEIRNNKKVGDIISARITHLESFGAFCDVGCGNIALLPIDFISVSRISHPRDRFNVGDDIKVIIKNIDEKGRITLSFKELLGTWEENAALFSQGQTVSGVIRSVEEYGVFIELTPNLAGLAEPRPDVYIGQTAGVYIKSIIPEKMKLKLVIIDAFDNTLKSEIKYFYNGDHIDLWNYSPEIAYKKIFTEF